MTKHFAPSRRDLLKGGGALIVSFSLAGRTDGALAEVAAAQHGPPDREVDAFLAIDAAGRVTLYSGKVDWAPACARHWRRSCAEELDVPFVRSPWSRVIRRLRRTRARPGAASPSSSAACRSATRRRPRARRCSKRQRKRLDVKPENSRVANGVVVAGNRRVSYGELVGGRLFALKLDHAKPAKFKDAEGLHDRRQIGAARRHPGEGDRHASRTCTTSACPACCTAASCGRRRSARKLESVDEGSIKTHPRPRARRARRQLPRRRRPQRMGRDQGCA